MADKNKPIHRRDGVVVQTPDEPPEAGEPSPPDGFNALPERADLFDSAFLDNLAHQLVAPLQCIENHCQNILDGLVPPEKVETRLGEVVGHAKMVTALAMRMRYLHQMVTGQDGITAQRTEFRKVVSTIIACFNNYLPVLKERKIGDNIDHRTMNVLPDVRASPLATHQLFMNLFDNAAKYASPGAKITVTAKELRNEGCVELSFSHQGVRIPAEDAERIFERGVRSAVTSQVRAEGTGVGLWVCRRLMLAVGGSIRCLPAGRDGNTDFRVRWRVA